MNYESNYDDSFFKEFDRLCGDYKNVPFFKARLKFFWQLLACTMHNLKESNLQASFRFCWEENEVIIQETGQMKYATFSLEIIENEYNHNNKHQFYEEWYDEVLSCLYSLRTEQKLDPAISLQKVILQTFRPGESPITTMDCICQKELQIYFLLDGTYAYVTPAIQAYFGVSLNKLLEIAGKNTEQKYPLAAQRLEDFIFTKKNQETWATEQGNVLHQYSHYIKSLPVLSVTHDSYGIEMIYYSEFQKNVKQDSYLISLSKQDILLLDASCFSEQSILQSIAQTYPNHIAYKYEKEMNTLKKIRGGI